MTHTSVHPAAALAAHTEAVDAPAELLDQLGPGGFVWLHGNAGFVTSGVVAEVAPADAPAFLAALPQTRDDRAPHTAGPRAVGALPFAGTGVMTIPARIVGRDPDGRAWCTTIAPGHAPAALHAAGPAPSRFSIEPCTTQAEWRDAVKAALAFIEHERVEKVVLARAVRIEADEYFDVRHVLTQLRRTQPGCTVYADGSFVGATPELLVRKRATDVVCRPLAGTARDAATLLASDKDRREHQLVVDAVRRALAASCHNVTADDAATFGFADVTHFGTTITAHASIDASVLDLVQALHPTPAVAGTPRDAALDAISRLDPVARGRSAGPCGWVDANGDGTFVVALRGGRIDGRHALLHAGAGIVRGSDPDAEWVETQQKLEPMLRVLIRP
jgi:menaquinone-specific isochorismate synthase